MSNIFIHPLAEIKTTNVGKGTYFWQFSVVLEKATIGENCNINCHTFIENDVSVGNNVTIKSGVFLWDGVTIENNVFIGPNVTFTNDKYPKSKQYPEQFSKILIKEGASIGANTTILPNMEIGRNSLVGAGSLITKSVPDNAIVYGNPATIKGWLDADGEKMEYNGTNWIDNQKNIYQIIDHKLVKKS